MTQASTPRSVRRIRISSPGYGLGGGPLQFMLAHYGRDLIGHHRECEDVLVLQRPRAALADPQTCLGKHFPKSGLLVSCARTKVLQTHVMIFFEIPVALHALGRRQVFLESLLEDPLGRN